MKTNSVTHPYGLEPKIVENLTTALNWYSYEKGRKDAYNYLSKYVSKSLPEVYPNFKKVSDSDIVPTYGWLARMLTIGSLVDDKIEKRLRQYINGRIESSLIPSAKKIELPAIKKDDVVIDDISAHLGELEGEIDKFITTNKSDLDIKEWVKSNKISTSKKDSVIKWCKDKIQEFSDALNTDGIREQYSNFTNKKMTSLINFIKKTLDVICNTTTTRTKATSAIKKKPPVELTKNVKYLKEISELPGISSKHPSEIIGCDQVWIYNPKYKTVQFYKAMDDSGLFIQGCSFKNHNEELSIQLILKTPKDILTNIHNAGKVGLRTVLDKIKTKRNKAPGRINENCFIIKAIK